MTGYWIPSHFAVSFTPSLVHRIFYVSMNPDINSIRKGDHVIFILKNDLVKKLIEQKGTNRIIKIVACMGGSVLKVDDRKDYYCDKEFLARAKDYAKTGVPVKIFIFNGQIPAGKLFVIGQHIDSFDSRYFGFVEIRDVIAKAYPIL